jgi:hypothetical protein
VQATAIDRDGGLIRLTTTLVHGSGEWIASDWPVSPVTETAAPHRMGAALTYARRYALFTLVGIAGEDDLDAPDLAITAGPSGAHNRPTGPGNGRSQGQTDRYPLQPPERGTRAEQPMAANLSTEASAGLRDRLISELDQLGDAVALAGWAHRALLLKSRLATVDAETVEAAFVATLNELEKVAPAAEPGNEDANGKHLKSERSERGSNEVTVIAKPVRERDRNHLRFVAAQPCLVCGRTPSDPHHIKFAEQQTLGRKPSDKLTVPICRLHHRELHRRGHERAWWQSQGIDPLPIAALLWSKTHALEPASAKIGGSAKANGQRTDLCLKTDQTKPNAHPEAG